MQQASKVDAEGEPLMPTLLLGDPCKECKAASKYICPHTTESVAPWKSTANRSKFAFLYAFLPCDFYANLCAKTQ